ncbi:MAG: hypothetical protein N3G76_01830 [Candidatus Micrarchaeota archaeon]|nr:hypothetical protein [Candidatus Micrarchaeota archaeon]
MPFSCPQAINQVPASIGVLQAMMNNESYVYAGILLVATATLIAIVYMLAKFIQSKKVESWVSNEAFQCLATAGILYLGVGIMLAASQVLGVFLIQLADSNNMQDVALLMCNADEPHMFGAKAYLLTRLDRLNSIYDWMFYTYAGSSIFGGMGAFFPSQGTFNFMLGLPQRIAENMESLLQYVYFGFLFVYIQLGFLELIKSYFAYAFAAGVVFRAVPFTHSLGSFLIASAVGLYFIYPAFLTIMLLANQDTTLNVTQNEFVAVAKSEFPGTYLSYYISKQLSHQAYYTGDPQSITGFTTAYETLKSPVQFLLLSMILYPLVAFVATYTFIHQFAELMEANISDLGRGLIRLI